MTEPNGLTIIRRMLDEGFAAGRTEVIDELCAPDMVEHQFGLSGTGDEARRKIAKAMADVHAMAPDIQYTIDDWVEQGDVTWVRATGRGTQTGPFFGPPSGKPFEIAVIDVIRVSDGRIAEHWGVPDRFALLAQAGLLPRPAEVVS